MMGSRRCEDRRPFLPIPSPFKGEGKGEGGSSMICSRSCKDGSQHGPSSAQHVIVPETENAVSGLSQISRPPRVGCATNHVLRTVKFYDQSALKAHEIHDVASNRMLTSELETTELAGPQMSPDQSLGVSGTLPKSAGEPGPALLRHPHPQPLPTKGEGELREPTSSLSSPLPLRERERVRVATPRRSPSPP